MEEFEKLVGQFQQQSNKEMESAIASNMAEIYTRLMQEQVNEGHTDDTAGNIAFLSILNNLLENWTKAQADYILRNQMFMVQAAATMLKGDE